MAVASPSSSSGGRDPFALLGLAPTFDVDLAALERAFFERSKQLHPDRAGGASAAERVAVLSQSRALNDAYQVLRREVSRAEYLLAQAGILIGDNERIDPALVMDLLEEREVLAEARTKGELREVERLQAAMRGRRTAALARVRELFARGREAYPEIKQQLILLRYVDRYLEECDSALDED